LRLWARLPSVTRNPFPTRSRRCLDQRLQLALTGIDDEIKDINGILVRRRHLLRPMAHHRLHLADKAGCRSPVPVGVQVELIRRNEHDWDYGGKRFRPVRHDGVGIGAGQPNRESVTRRTNQNNDPIPLS